ncbi:hypothetical protein ACSFA7_23960 [Variovorax sp. LT1R20]|uniref:hypothetical protein n=1 Tax=Variovorax sp. LT1R20 TaxID=3443729 RepID=UPI003F4457F2
MPYRLNLIVNLININYIRGLYDFLFDRSEEELEGFDVNLSKNQKILFEEMVGSFKRFGPISRKNIIDGLNLIYNNYSDEDLWRSAIPHDLPLGRVTNRQAYLRGVIFALSDGAPSLLDKREFLLVDEIGPSGLDFSK